MFALPLQLIDSFLLQITLGQVLLVVFVVGVLGVLPLKSRQMLSLHVIGFGLLFLLTPQSLLEGTQYKFVGLALVLVGPVLYTTARS